MKKVQNLLPMAFLGFSLLVMSCKDVATNQIPALRSELPSMETQKMAKESSSVETQTMAKESSSVETQTMARDIQKAVSSSDSLSRLIADYKRIEREQNGVCDTCVTGFVSVLIEHRAVSKQLSDEIQEMRNKLDAVKVSNSRAFALINTYQRQSAELQNIVSLRANLIQENQKQVAELRQRKSDLSASKALLEKARY